ncbi:MAG: methionyl-tRNA formyltransferase [Patescibacteria group bacterium]
MISNKIKIAFFGTSEISVIVLNELKKVGFAPKLVVTMPDKQKGRKLVLTSPSAKVWAQENKIDFVQPEKLDEMALDLLREGYFDLFVVASYGKILKQELLDIPKHGTLNVHPSLLPKLRGASPIISAILEDEKKTGVTIMLLDAGMDSGPILAQASIEAQPWPPKASELGKLLVSEGGKMLTEVIPQWIAGKITPEKQDDNKATFTKKIIKKDGLIELDGDPYKNLLKIRAFEQWPGTYFFAERNNKQIRVKITEADLEDGQLKIRKVVPEGKKEMDYEDFLRG